MQSRFCTQCGTKVAAGGKFCSACGTPVGGAAPVSGSGSGWRLTGAGAAVLGGIIIGGLAIWAVILSPTPPIPRPGERADRPAPGPAGAPGGAAPAMPPDHPPVTEIPDEAKTFIADLETKAKERPTDVEAWRRLALVTSRAAQIDPSYEDRALAAFGHALEIAPKDPDVLRGAANLRYDRKDYKEAIGLFERYLALRPDDNGARTDLATMYFQSGDSDRAIAIYKEVIGKDPSFLQAHYNLAITYHRKGDSAAALASLEAARKLAKEDSVRAQIDQAIAQVKGGGGPVAAAGAPAAEAPAAAASTAATPFQRQVEEALRGHPIMGPKIVRIEWPGPATGRVMLQNFPMAAMPPEVRDKFTTRLIDTLRTAAEANGVSGPARLELADVSTGTVMATVDR